MGKKWIVMLAVLALFSAFGVPSALAAEEQQPDLRFYADAARTRETDSARLVLGGDAVDVYYTVKGKSDKNETLKARAEDASAVDVFVLSNEKTGGKIRFVAVADEHSAGEVKVTVTAEGCAPQTLTVVIDYAQATSLALKTDGARPGYFVALRDPLKMELGVPQKIYAEAADAKGNISTLDPALEYVWTFENNLCGAAFADGFLTVTEIGTAEATVALKLNGEPLGVSRSFHIAADYQLLSSDLEILADGLPIIGIRYTAGSDTASVLYQQDGETLSRDVAVAELRLSYTASNLAYTDSSDIVWSSTDSETVQVTDGCLTFAQNITGSKQVTVTLTNRDKTVMDSVLIVITTPGKSGCGAAGGTSGCEPFAAAALLCALGGAVVRRRVQSVK